MGWEDPLEKVTAYTLQYSGPENSVDYTTVWGLKESDTTEQLSLSLKPEISGKVDTGMR